MRRRNIAYLAGAAALLLAYAVAAPLLWIGRDWADDGPLSYGRPAATAPPADVTAACRALGRFDSGSSYSETVVGAEVGGRPYYACYQVRRSTGAVWKAAVVDGRGVKAPDAVIKSAGAWRWIGVVKTPFELVLGGVALAVLLALYLLYWVRPRPGVSPPVRWWQSKPASAVLGVLCVLPLTLPFRRSESRARRVRLLYEWVFGVAGFFIATLWLMAISDPIGATTLGLLAAGVLWGWLGGRALLRPPPVPQAIEYAPTQVLQPTRTIERPAPASRFRVQRPGDLPTFADVGGMAGLKAELDDTLGLLLPFAGEAAAYRISFNGILLHGPPGVGKTYVAKATAGEYGLNFLPVSTGDLVSKYVGESAANLKAVFAEAVRNVPCLLFFDEFDSIAERRDDNPDGEAKRLVNQLLQSLEEWHGVPELVVMAATNHLDRLDPAAVRPGRFDRLIRVDLPDLAARRAVLDALLAGRPVAPGVDLDGLAERLAGRTPAVIGKVVESAALAAFRTAAETGVPAPIDDAALRAALAGLGGADRPTVEDWTWDRLVLPEETLAELRQVQAMVADPELARRYGVQPPSGLLLAGPPGTGKTTVARVFAAQAGCSFYSVTASDLTSKWVGESEANVTRLFERARDNAPSIVFLDEVDALASDRDGLGGGPGSEQRLLNQLLAEMDGLAGRRGVFTMAATNRPDALDPALLRGGRLSRTVDIPLPDRAGRRRLLGLFTARMPLAGAVDLDALAGRSDGLSGADLEALCGEAAMRAMRHASAGDAMVGPEAFDAALAAGDVRVPVADVPEHRPGGYL